MSVYYDYLTIEIKEGNFSVEKNLNTDQFTFDGIDESVTNNNMPIIKFQIYVRSDSNIKEYIRNNKEYKANYYLLSSNGYYKKYIDIGTGIVETGALSKQCYDYYCNRNLIALSDEGDFYGTVYQEINEGDYESTDEYHEALENCVVDKNEELEKEIRKFASSDEIYKII